MAKVEPLPCPFCGDAPTIGVAHPYVAIRCDNDTCPGGGWQAKTRATAVKKWNTRKAASRGE